MTPKIGECIATVLQVFSVVIAIVVLHRTLFKNEDRYDGWRSSGLTWVNSEFFIFFVKN